MLKKLINYTILLLVIAALVVGGYYYYQHEKFYPSTDDAYIQANIVNIAPRITGKVIGVYVKDHEKIKKGQLLFRIDPEPFQIAVNQAVANLNNTIQQIKAAKAAVQAASALVAQRKAELTNASKSEYRIMSLVKKHLASIAEGDKVTESLKVAEAAYQSAKNQLNEAQQKLGNPGDNNARIKSAKATLAKATLNLHYTQIVAPANGYIAKFTLRQGEEVTAYQPLFVLIEDQLWWASANFKETDMQRIHAGQTAKIKIDMYPNHLFQGKVMSISASSGVSFSLLPPENATGNWVKITQRFPVRVRILNPTPHYPLRMGASATVTINTLKP